MVYSVCMPLSRSLLSSDESLGLLNLASSTYLVAISKREQVAQIRGKPIYVITNVALIPLASQSEAQHAIQHAKTTLKSNKPESLDTSDDEDDSGSTVDDEHDDNASVEMPDEPLNVPKGSVNKATTVVADVIKNKGQYGRFAQRWFSKGGWKSDGIRKQGMSASEDDLTMEQKKQAEASLPDDKKDEIESVPVNTESQPAPSNEEQPTTEPTPVAPGDTTLATLIPRILKTTNLYFTSRSFYFSYDYDLSRSLSRQESTSASVPLHKRFDPLVTFTSILALNMG